MNIISNNQSRFILDAYELTDEERLEFDYLDWGAIDEGSGSASFFRYKDMIYDLGEFMRIPENSDLEGWHGAMMDTAFSGVIVKLSSDGETVIVGRYYS